ncbi:Fc receptor-like protein 5 isoform 2-T2 [Pangshura tecta]
MSSARAQASLLPQPVFPAAKHPAPTFSVHPQKAEYLLGDTVGLTCSAPSGRDPVSIFQYYSNMGWAVSARVSARREHTYNLNITEPRSAGLYSCNYYTSKSDRFVPSSESNRISIRVKDPPPEPTLSVDPPSGVVSEGHPLLITCTAPGDARQLRFHFYQDGAKIVPEDIGSEISTAEPRTSSVTVSVLSIPQANTNSTGEYVCRYEEKESGRWILSTRSQAVTVTLKDPPPRPVLTVDPPSGGVNEGFPLLITCTASGDAGDWRFHFYKDGAKIIPQEPGPSSRNGSVFSIPRAGLSSAGEFTCGYEENVNGRWVPSPRSLPVNITVKEPLPLPVLSMEPPSGAVSKGIPLVITCTAPGDAREWRFHFYKDGAEIIPGDMGSEISATEPSTDSMMLTFPRAVPESTGEFTCSYEENVSGRWIPSPRSQAVNVTMKEPLPLPVLSMEPLSGVVSKGIPLVITCTAPGDAREWRFHFYKDGAEIIPGDMGSEISATEPSTDSMMLTFPRAVPESTGEFTCSYEENVSGRWIPSPRSQAVNVTMKEPLPLPVLSMEPLSGVVSKGIPLVITCTAPGHAREWRFHFYKDGAEIIPGDMGSEISTTQPSTDSMMLTFPRAVPESTGEFTCSYEENVSGRWILSPRSQAVNVTMKEPLPLPVLSMEPLSGVVSKGIPLVITCTAPGDAREWRFHFYKDGAEIIPGDMGSEISATEPSTDSMMLTFPRAVPESTGEFTCSYEENVSGRWIPSPRSQAVNVTMKAIGSLPIPLVAGCAGAAVGLVLLLLLVCLYKRMKKGSKWERRRRAQNDGSISSYSPMPLAMISPDTL